ncbi:MAG: ABC transporter ATP-binding protein [Anaerolineae bacterium]|nr:ABC transporter ATP-binding protein [Anaerolineales bacterium]MCQ3975722.1 ABC transporter ATP-binding protein [Anaerolineae bacterium]
MTTDKSKRQPVGLVIEHLTKIFGGHVKAIDDISLTVQPGQMVSFLGPSGCGKTTTLNCIAGLESPDEGLIRVGDFVMTDTSRKLNLRPEERGLGMVFQSYALWPHMTVHDNVAFSMRLHKTPAPEIKRRVSEILELVGLGKFGDRYPFQLSGGQQQRVALARAVVTEPPLLLLDEPLSNLDAKVREQARVWLRGIQKRLGITTVYVTHDQAEALAMSDMIAVISQGKLVQYAPPTEVYENPASRFVAEFIGATSFLTGSLVERSGEWARVRLPQIGEVKLRADRGPRNAVHDWSPNVPVTVAIRSERVQVVHDGNGPSDNTFDVKVAESAYEGARWLHMVETPVGTLRLETLDAAPDHHLRLHLPPDSLFLVPE